MSTDGREKRRRRRICRLYTRAALMLRHLCVKNENRKYRTKIYIVRHSTKPRFDAHPTGLISWKISAKVEMSATLIFKLTILISDGLPGFLDKRRRQRVWLTSFSVSM